MCFAVDKRAPLAERLPAACERGVLINGRIPKKKGICHMSNKYLFQFILSMNGYLPKNRSGR
jgi:hypothetical protein